MVARDPFEVALGRLAGEFLSQGCDLVFRKQRWLLGVERERQK
jgi:hypothetical protein